MGGIFGGSKKDKSPEKAANIQADSQREALEYLKEREKLPQELREGALTKLNEYFSDPDKLRDQQDTSSPEAQQNFIDQAINSPLYKSLIGGREAGEDAILRNASATGGLRSGNVQANLYKYDTQLQNKALLESYNNQVGAYTSDLNQKRASRTQNLQGLQGLANLPSLAPAIAQGTTAIGTTIGQGIIGGAQSQQQNKQQGFGNILGAGQLGLSAYDSGLFSDRRLKQNIKKVGEIKDWNIYTWDWNIVAQKMGLIGSSIGCMADEVFKRAPHAVMIKDLFMLVKYNRIGLL